MTKQVHDDDMTGIAGGGNLHLLPKLGRILSRRLQGAGHPTPTPAPTPGGPGPDLEAEGESDGLHNLSPK